MANNLYITATESKSGKSAVVLGMMQLLLRDIRKVAFFRPIINRPVTDAVDHDTNLILTHFNLDIPVADTYAYSLQDARELINNGQHATLLENILKKYKQLEDSYDFVLCEGTDFLGKDAAFEFDLNADIAANLGCPVMVVANGQQKTAHEIVASTQLTIDLLDEKGLDIVAAVINRASVTDAERDVVISSLECKVNCSNPLAVYVVPEEPTLGKPTMGDVKKWLNAQVLYGHGRMDTLVDDYVIAAMQIGNFLDYVTPGCLVITPGDRSDIILTGLATRLSGAYPDISGMLLTGGIQPAPNVHRLIEGWTGVPIPILSVKDHTYKTIQTLNELYGKIEPDNERKINTALGLFERSVDSQELGRRLINRKSSRITPMMFEFNLIERAKQNRMRIVLPEGVEERILRAADILARREVADIILLGDADKVGAKVSELGIALDGVQIIQPNLSPKFEEYAQAYFELRKHKGVSIERARDTMNDVTYFGTMMVHKGDAEGMVSGSINTTAHTIRPAFEFIKTKPGFSIVSSVFLMCLKDRVLAFGDCAVNPNPTAEQLAEIAINSAHTARIFGIEPRVAMLSYSTGSSGKGADVEKVIEATRIAKERAPELLLEGPLQYDAAIDMDVARTKLPGSQVAGQATVFIFPDLNTGNNTYKAVQRAAGAVAIGPVLQGLNKPVNDLSRGCTVPDIVNTVAITAIQAQAEKGLI
ncbi:phosphate acetyltransferase [Nitratidesulfovibrio sp. SRB-5]|uniref:Phosphate acetyltransferase n=1 Tax=Nitratidesulfovibrio vulgaris (strain DSM 19637 / Miyazaki F) TaxID=883 RepID=B8DMG4_NITV9|nr:phosphate acetyltransferase [Nitratidesulfovibrio sp. SRB-5]MBZ2171973.1 phosphate acetyltransferase [Nitratidesulfovibrio sp. SRB-5]RXF78547.1 phosphate acetyltransferase [Desulfovibrio sp. DS-1]